MRPAHKMVEIEWQDSYSDTKSWIASTGDEEEYPDYLYCRSVGYLLKATPKTVHIASSLSASGQCGGFWCIPRKAVISMKPVNGRNKRK